VVSTAAEQTLDSRDLVFGGGDFPLSRGDRRND
jgi:hypothetical protein